MSVLSGPIFLRHLSDVGAAIVVLLPLVALTRCGYDRTFWWQPSRIDLLPFPTRWMLPAPVGLWYGAFWAVSVMAVLSAAMTDRLALVAGLIGLTELAYRVRRGRKALRPLPAEMRVLVPFALWHNALAEEVLFRGPVWLFGLSGASGLLSQAVVVLGSALAFGGYHIRPKSRGRAWDTALFGVVLGILALAGGLAAAILAHGVHNALSIPLRAERGDWIWRKIQTGYSPCLLAFGIAELMLRGA